MMVDRRAEIGGHATVTGETPAILGNAVSDAIYAATSKGMGIDEAVSVVVAVAADYARDAYGPEYVVELAKALTLQAEARQS